MQSPFVFTNETLIEMFALRASGIPIFAVAKKFGRDRHTVRSYLTEHNIPMLSLDLRKPKEKKLPIRYYAREERICAGKTYAEYLADSLKRKQVPRYAGV